MLVCFDVPQGDNLKVEMSNLIFTIGVQLEKRTSSHTYD